MIRHGTGDPERIRIRHGAGDSEPIGRCGRENEYRTSLRHSGTMVSLPPDARTAIHDASLTVLSDVGMAVEHETARRVLREAGATVDGDIVTVSPSLVTDALDSAPATFTWHARNPDNDVTVGEGPAVVTPGTGARHVWRPDEKRRPAAMDDFETLARLAHVTDALSAVGFDLCSPEPYALAGNPGGFEDAAVGYELLATLLRHTDEPLVGGARTAETARASIELAAIARGEADAPSQPAVLGRVHPRSPRLWNEPLVDGLLTYARAEQPLVVSSGAIAGASAPHSLAETVVLANAETLFGVVLTQAVSPGTPVVFGYGSTAYDHEHGTVAFGDPIAGLLSGLGVAMGTHYGLPTRADGGVTDAKTVDDQAGAESMLRLADALRSDADVVFNAAGLLDTYDTVSPEKFVLDCERIRAVRATDAAREALLDRLTDGSLSLDAIDAADPGEAFADDRDLASIPDRVSFTPKLAVRGRYDDWHDGDDRTALQRASDHVDRLLDDYDRPPLPDDVDASIRAYVDDHSSVVPET
ncbi:MAG: trimethylamine methyltransferase family protein [Haloplanus sp.]